MALQNVGIRPQHYTASQTRRPRRHILNLSTRWKWSGLYHGHISPGTLWVGGYGCGCEENLFLPCRESNTGRPARNLVNILTVLTVQTGGEQRTEQHSTVCRNKKRHVAFPTHAQCCLRLFFCRKLTSTSRKWKDHVQRLD
jgi:hypothetical protein